VKKLAKFKILIEHMNQKQADELYELIIDYAESQELFAFACFNWADSNTGKLVVPKSKKEKKSKKNKGGKK